MKLKFNDLGAQWNCIKEEALPRITDLLERGWYIGGPEVERFENNFANYTDTKHAVGVSNGTDALKLCIQVLELHGCVDVIMPANTYIADPLSVWHQCNPKCKYNITLIDCDEYYQIDHLLLKSYLSARCSDVFDHTIILPVHLYGHPVNMECVMKTAEQYNCFVIEDASQAHGAVCNGVMVGRFGHMCAYSLYPGKNLGAAGDAGIITTNDDTYCDKLKALRNYGSYVKYHNDLHGWNNRLDPLQAVILDEKLKHLDSWNEHRNHHAKDYAHLLKHNTAVILPKTAKYVDKNVYHIYTIRVKERDKLQKFLSDNNIPTVIHYPVPLQKSKIFNYLDTGNDKTVEYADQLLSLPMHPFMTSMEVQYICDTINKFYL